MKSAIPVINLQDLDTPAGLQALDSACCEWGVFEIVEHGVDNACIETLFEAMAGFFSQSREDKLAIERTQTNPWGYYDKELTKNVLDLKQIYDYGPADGDRLIPQWPQHPEGFQSAVTDYYQQCEQLSFRLLGALAQNLGLSGEGLAEGFRPTHTSFVRLNYYPTGQVDKQLAKVTHSQGQLGISPHTDAGALTILLHDETPGLQVFNGGEWHTLVSRRGALLVNIGDIVQVWSNDRYAAPLHRVAASTDAERFSAPFFFNPSYAMNYAPLPGVVDSMNPPRYRSINWGEFRDQRALGDYGDYGEEVQISQYRTAEAGG